MTQDVIIKIGLFVFAIVIFFILDRIFKRKADEKKDNFLRHFYRATKKPLQALFFITLIYFAMRQVGLNIQDHYWLNKAYAISTVLIIAWLAIQLVQFGGARVLRRFDMTVVDNLQARAVYTQIDVIRRLAISVIIIVAIGAVLMSFEEIKSLGVSLLASAGVAGIVLGLAAQKTIGNFFTGIQIAITQPIRIDDSVVVEGEWGWIEEINLTYVVVKLWDLRRLVLPISYFVEKPFQNWTRQTAEIIGSVFFYLDYTMPIEPIRQELDRILETTNLWNKKTKVVQVTDSKERTMEIRILVSANNAPIAWDLRCFVREKMLEFIQENYSDKLPRTREENNIYQQGDKPQNA